MANYAHEYNITFLIAIYIGCLSDAQRRFLNCLKRNMFTFLTQVLASFMHIFWCWFFIDYMKCDVWGVGMASIVTQIFNMFCTTTYIYLLPEV